MKKGVKIALAVLVGLAVITVVVSHARRPRSELSQRLSFVAKLEPKSIRSGDATVDFQDLGVPPTLSWNYEHFELEKSQEEINRLIQREIGPKILITLVVPDGYLYSVDQGSTMRLMFIQVQKIGPHRSSVIFGESHSPDAADRFFAWIRRITGG